MTKNLVFLFMSRNSASPGTTRRVYPQKSCGDYYNRNFRGECYFIMLEQLVRLGVIDRLSIFYESELEPGLANWVIDPNLKSKIHCEVIPEIRHVAEYIDKNTIIFVRGGFKHWYNFLAQYKDQNWLMLYAANTGRQKWTFWDVILSDITDSANFVDRNGRYIFKFTKPTNEEVFFNQNLTAEYDICIGASHIHDRKGQYRVVKAIEYLNKSDIKINCILPGSPRGGINTQKMMARLPRIENIKFVNYVSKAELASIFNRSKYFVHAGNHGQNDRSVFEAMACGTSVLFHSVSHHDPVINNICFRLGEVETDYKLAKVLKYYVESWQPRNRNIAETLYHKYFGFDEVVIPKMEKLISFMFENKPQSKNLLPTIFKGKLCNP